MEKRIELERRGKEPDKVSGGDGGKRGEESDLGTRGQGLVARTRGSGSSPRADRRLRGVGALAPDHVSLPVRQLTLVDLDCPLPREVERERDLDLLKS